MSARKGRVDPAQQKARRQKIIVGVGAVILLALIAFEAPKVLNRKSGATAAPVSTDVSTTSTNPDSPPVEPGAPAQPAAAVVPSTSLPDVGGASASDGQLVSFSLFQSKDPFRQQLTDSGQAPPAPPATTPPSSSPPATTPPTSSPPSSGQPPTSTPPAPPSTPPTTTPSPPTTTGPTAPKPSAPTSASISVNGVAETVAIGASFPQAQPLFRLVSLESGVARIGVAGGTLQGSSQSVELVKGKSLTLMNTADGMRYVLRLVSVA